MNNLFFYKKRPLRKKYYNKNEKKGFSFFVLEQLILSILNSLIKYTQLAVRHLSTLILRKQNTQPVEN